MRRTERERESSLRSYRQVENSSRLGGPFVLLLFIVSQLAGVGVEHKPAVLIALHHIGELQQLSLQGLSAKEGDVVIRLVLKAVVGKAALAGLSAQAERLLPAAHRARAHRRTRTATQERRVRAVAGVATVHPACGGRYSRGHA